jgi:multiple sugar transport system permease protein
VLRPLLFFLPAGLLLVGINIVSSAFGIYIGFLDWSWLRIERRFDFVGLGNFAAIGSDPVFWVAAQNTLVWSLGVVPGAFLVGLYFALLLNEEIRAASFFRTAILIPWTMPLVVVAVMWAYIVAPGYGPMADLFVQLGWTAAKHKPWLGDPQLALPIVMATQIWRWAPFFAITLLAGLQSIPAAMYEAAQIDGAGAIGRFRHITLPSLGPLIVVLILQGLIWSFKSFTLVYVMTKGGPVNSTEMLTTYLWRLAFTDGMLGRASAVGTVLACALAVIGTVWVVRLLRSEPGR